MTIHYTCLSIYCASTHAHVVQHSPRSEKFSCLVQVEHCGSIIGSCNKPDWGKDKIIDVDLEVKVQCTASDPQSLVNATTNPLIGELV